MNTKRTTAPRATRPDTTDSRGSKRVYIDLPAESVRRFNILAATRGVAKRALLAQIVEEALKAAKIA